MFSRSPKVPRHGLQQLKQDGVDDEDRVIAGVEFAVQYVGSTGVSEYCGTGSGKTEVPVTQVIEQNKSKGSKKPKRMIMTVCYKSLTVKEEQSDKLVASFPISKVTYCNVDVKFEKVFVFIARDRAENPFKAYVFMCESKSKAAELFKVLSLAFTLNYESYQASLVRQANMRADARAAAEGKGDDNPGRILPFEGENKMHLQNGTSEDSGNNNHIMFDQSAFNPSESPNIPKISEPGDPSPKNFLFEDKRYKHLGMEATARSRSHTDPPKMMHIPQPPAPSNTASTMENARTTTTNIEDDFDAEFTQLAKSRSNTATSDISPFHSGNTQKWPSDPGLVRLQIH